MPQKLSLPQRFRAAGLHCGIKDDTSKLDLALFVSDVPATAAGVFTQNRVCGAPVKISRERVPRTTARATLISSGNANACTGQRGVQDARWMTSEVARLLRCDPDDVLVCSTGVIGQFLPRDKLEQGIPHVVEALSDSSSAFRAAARGMMTTDTFCKQAAQEVKISGRPVRVAGACKGAAMIAPNMATMLAVIMTDAELRPADADGLLREAVNRTFNCISVEGHTSTSDSVILLANGAAGTGPLDGAQRSNLGRMIVDVSEELARSIVRDAEGADHLITVDVLGLRSRDEAYRVAKAVAESPLVKTAVTGADPNWGRIVSAAGYAGVDIKEDDISLRINGTLICERGAPVEFDERAVSDGMRHSRAVSIALQFGLGDAAVRFWTSDLTAEYVRLNSDYTT